jgi:hypothetical protein
MPLELVINAVKSPPRALTNAISKLLLLKVARVYRRRLTRRLWGGLRLSWRIRAGFVSCQAKFQISNVNILLRFVTGLLDRVLVLALHTHTHTERERERERES